MPACSLKFIRRPLYSRPTDHVARSDRREEKRLAGGDLDARARTNSAARRPIALATGYIVEAVLALFLITVVRGRRE
jgi:hypothetical protein